MGMNKEHNKPPLSYAQAGVDIDAGNALVQSIKPLIAATMRPGADGSIGGFGGVFDLKATGYKDPLLVAANDGVGTKLKIAIETNAHDTIGIDLVAMCVNDLIVQGAEPLFFLDYFATGKLDNGIAERVIAGIAKGCKMAGCALTGGETAEMPGMYSEGDFDLAGFSVGAVEREALLPTDTLKSGDVLLGLASSGIHSNGFSLVRRIVERTGLSWNDKAPFDETRTLGEALLEPTRIYVHSVLSAQSETGGFFRFTYPKHQIIALSISNGIFAAGEFQLHLGQSIAARRIAHKRFSRFGLFAFEFQNPKMRLTFTGLHGRLCGTINFGNHILS